MNGSLLSIIVLVAAVGLVAALYLLPVLVGWARGAPDIGAVAVIDILLGWTFLGWVVALAMALRSVHPAVPVVQVTQNPPASLPPGESRGAGWAGPYGPPRPRRISPPPLELPPARGRHPRRCRTARPLGGELTMRQAHRTASVRLHGLLAELVIEPVESPTPVGTPERRDVSSHSDRGPR